MNSRENNILIAFRKLYDGATLRWQEYHVDDWLRNWASVIQWQNGTTTTREERAQAFRVLTLLSTGVEPSLRTKLVKRLIDNGCPSNHLAMETVATLTSPLVTALEQMLSEEFTEGAESMRDAVIQTITKQRNASRARMAEAHRKRDLPPGESKIPWRNLVDTRRAEGDALTTALDSIRALKDNTK